MTIVLQTGIIRILDSHRQTVGTGFILTNDGLIVTCAHVITDAGAGPSETVYLSFPHTGNEATANVEPDGWREPRAEDVAILRLNDPLPAGVIPLPLGYSTGSDDHNFKTFGFPNPNPIGGLRGDGHILGKVTLDSGIQVLQLRSQEVTGGFSGAPVWDEVVGQVVGMVTATIGPDRRERLTETAFATPTETLLDVWPSLPISTSSLVSHSLPFTHFGTLLSSPSIVSQEQTPYVISTFLVSQFEYLAAQLSAETQRHLEIMRTALREGRHEEAIKWLTEIKTNHARWSVLSPEVKAKLLCFEASIMLDTTGDTSRARQLADQAHNFAPTSNEIRVRAFITYLEGDSAAAIRLLEGKDDVDSLNLTAALLLETNRINECRAILEQASISNQSNPETLRIRALFHLATKDINQAQLEIQKAVEFGPRWRSVRFAAAVINYYSSLSPLALPDRLVPWPEPVDWILVKRNDQSLSRLRESAEIFQELAQTTQIAREEKHRFEVWRLACLATVPDRYEEANEYAQVLLQDAPTNFRVIAWIVARNFQVNLEPSRLALEQLVTDEAAHVFHIVALTSCYLVFQNAPEAVKLLDDTKPIFQEHQAEALWTFWYIQALVIQGETGAACEVIDGSELKTELQHVQTITLVAKARESGNWQELIQHLEDIYEATKNANFLLDLCEIMAQQDNWDYIADRAEILIKVVSTSEAVRFAVIAAHNAERFKFCLELIDRHQHLFRQRKLPSQLRQVRVACQHALGLLPEAIVEAETLAREEPTVENLLALANLYLNKGDLKGLTIVARKLNNRTDLIPESLLGLARLVQWEDHGLANSFWRKATSQDLPDELVSEALALGFQLGLDDEVVPLMEKMAELGHQGKGGIQVKNVEDFIEFLKQRQEHTIKLDEIYRDGMGPIHLIAEQLGEPLINFYHRFLIENATIKNPRRQLVLLARHGGRALPPGFPDSRPQWRLNVDITAILLAAHLDILTEIEETFKPLHIPAALIRALLRMRKRVSPPQPSRLEIYRQIIDLQKRDMLAVVQCEIPPDYANTELVTELGEEWVALFEEVRTNSGYLVDHLPLHKRISNDPPTALPEDATQYLVNCRGVVDALREQGPLSEGTYSDAIQALGTEGVVSGDIIPTPGKLLCCYGNIPEVLAEANLLQLVCEHFQVRISQREFEGVQGALKEHEQRQATAEWLDRLIDRLNRGVDDGTYAIIPSPPYEEGEMEKRAAENLDVECLRTVLKFEAAEGDVIWADDRWINSYLHRNGVPIIGINEILKAIVGAGTLTVGEYYQKIIKLRAANVRFVPVQTDEIIHHLRQARVENRELVETQELKILRRYVAACLYRGDILQRPMEGRPNEHGELAFLLGLGRTLTNAFVELWLTGEDDEITRQSRAEWLLANLYVDHLGLSKVPGVPRVQQDDRYMVAISLTGLIAHAISFDPARTAVRRDYLDWLFHRILKKRFEADQELILLVVDMLKKILLDTIQGESDQNPPKSVMILLLGKFYDDLPTAIHDELGRDTDFMARIGLISLNIITIDEFNFDGDNFIQAVNEAVNGRRATIAPLGSDTEIIFQPVEDHPGELVFSYDHPESGVKKIVAGDNLVVLLGSPSERETALRRNRQWFDCPRQKFDEIVAEIASMEDPQRRIDAVESWRNTSIAEYYTSLEKILRKQRNFQFDNLLPPSVEGLLRHFRLSPDVKSGEAFQEALNVAARALIDEENLILTIDRLVSLPVPLPAPLVNAFIASSLAEQRQIIKRLIRIAGSPLSRIHLVHLLLDSGSKVPAFQRLAWRIVKNLFTPEGIEAVEAFFAILKWVNGEFGNWPDVRHWPAHVRLTIVWAHAHRLFSIFISAGAPISWLQNTFSQASQHIHFEAFEWDADYWLDIAHPRNVNRDAFLLAGLFYALGEETNTFTEKGLKDLVVSHAFMNVESVRAPNFKLLRDTSQAPNPLNSFLGGNLGEKLSPLLGTEDAAIFTHASLQNLIEQTIDNIAEESNVMLHWAWLLALVGDMPPSRGVVDRLRSTLHQTNFETLLQKDAELGLLVIQVASLQVKHLGDEALRLQLKNGLVQIAKRLSDLGMSQEVSVDNNDLSGQDEVSLRLLETALHISKAVQTSENVTTEFLDIVTQLIEAWSVLMSIFKPIIQRLCEELPISQAHQFWPLLVRLRAK